MNRILNAAVGLSRPKNNQLLFARLYAATGTKEHLDTLVNGNKIVVFMKGTPDAPRCGFSNAVMQILDFHGIKDFDAHDVLADEDLRQGVKDFSNWPTIPQVYIAGEFVGGCDIMIDMHKNGELIDELKKVGIVSDLVNNPDKQP